MVERNHMPSSELHKATLDIPSHFPFYFWLDDKTELILVKEGNQLRAFQSICPHMGARLEYDARAKEIKCPWHGLRFCQSTLLSSHERYKKLKEFALETREGKLFIYG